MEGRVLRVALVTLATLLAGCAAPPQADIGSRPTNLPAATPVVVAVIDAGSSPYLPIFEARSVTLPVDTVPLKFTKTGTIKERFEADEDLWASLERGVLYSYEGTRLLGITFREEPPSTGQTIDNARHGSRTTYLVAREAPDAIIVSVQVSVITCEDRTECALQPHVVEALEWVAAQPWIDVISVSMGLLGNPPDTHAADATAEEFVQASRAASESGKLLVIGAGNYAAPPLTAPQAGPPWVIAAGGVERNASGESVLASKGVDVVANFSEYTPNLFNEFEWSIGTSLATPIVAGTLARAIDIVRAHGGVADPAKLRAALNASAIYFSAAAWDPTPPGRDPLPDDLLNSASLPVLVQPQMGWGYVDGSFAEEIARRVLEDDLTPPPEKQQAILFQAQWQRAREEYWAQYAR